MKIHREGKVAILINTAFWLIVAVCTCIFASSDLLKLIVALAAISIIGILVFFFRVPQRKVTEDASLAVSPADGKVVQVRKVYVKEFFDCECTEISIFLSLFNVHITWFPIGGTVEYSKYYPGAHTFAFLPKSSEKNEHSSVVVKDAEGRQLMFRQIAGIVARRVVCYAKQGEQCSQASQAGFIRFGSRLTVFIPGDAEPLVKVGDKVKGSVSPIARLK